MKRTPNLKDVDKTVEAKAHQRKKLKGSRPPTNRISFSSDSEHSDRDEGLVKAKPRKVSDSSDELHYKLVKRQRKISEDLEIEEEEMTDGNDDECYLCDDGGDILCCDNCFRSFHMKCLQLTHQPEDNWLCPYCKPLQENKYEKCASCNDSLKEIKSYLKISCSKCLRRMHLSCARTPLSLIVDAPVNKNYVFDAKTVKDLKHRFFQNNTAPEELLKDIYENNDYEGLYHVCDGCLISMKIQKIKNHTKHQNGKNVQDFYLVKLKRSSDIHTFWVNHFLVENCAPFLLKTFLRKIDEKNLDHEFERQDLDEAEGLVGATESYRVEKILAFKRPIPSSKKTYAQITKDILEKSPKKKTPLYNYKFLVKWEDLDYSFSSWEDEFIIQKFKDKLHQYFNHRLTTQNRKKMPKPEKNLPKNVDFSEQPYFIKGQLYDYQFKGFKWLINQYLKRKNSILADEMGLGKTIQTLCFLKFLSEKYNFKGPFLVVAPNSTVYNWQREAQKWCPEYDIVIYLGNSQSRRKVLDLEFVDGKSHSQPKFHLMITTYSYINQDVNDLKKIKWEVVVVDEAQRLKNKESKLYTLCNKLQTNFKLLLTGTPIQNSVDELINLFKYLIPKDSPLSKEVDDLSFKLNPGKKAEFSDSDKKTALRKLKTILKDHMLRRTVQDAHLNFPELEEKTVKIDLTNEQKHLYKNILIRNYEVLANAENAISKQRGRKGGEGLRTSLINILMTLRLVCNHPDLFHSRFRDYQSKVNDFESEIINSSNKLKLLDKMIPRLLESGHKILMFTQFVLMLDIIEEFLIYRGLEYERLDGNTRNVDRQKIIDNFNNGKSRIFMLSTRAGGLGINLTSSDTVIFIDSDFNPYQDIQAFSRAYRIGQKNKVMVYRLVSRLTVEEKIVENATKKLMMGEIIMNPIDQSKADKSIIESILRYGTKDLFEQPAEEQDNCDITEDKLEELLNREAKQSAVKQKANDLNDYYLSGLNFIDFNFSPIFSSKNIDEETKENKYWETIMGDEHAELERKEVEDLGKGKRNKKTATTQNDSDHDSRESIDIQIPLEISSSGESGGVLSNSDSEYDINDFDVKTTTIKERKSTFSEEEEEDEDQDRIQLSIQALPEALQEYYGSLNNLYEEIKSKSTDELWDIFKIDETYRIKFVEFILKHGLHSKTEDFMKKLWDYLEPFEHDFRVPEFALFKNYLRHFYACLVIETPTPAMNAFFFFNVHPYIIRKRMLGFVYLRMKLSSFRAKIGKFKISSKEYVHMVHKKNHTSNGVSAEHWGPSDDFYLLDAIDKYGLDEWGKIIQDVVFWDHEEPRTLTPDQVWKTLFRRIEGYDPDMNQESECIEFVENYIKIRGLLLIDCLVDEKEKKKKTDHSI